MEDSLCRHKDLPLCSKFVLKFLIKCGKKYFEIYGCDWTSNFRRFKKISYILFICSANLNIVVILKLRNFSHFVRIINSLLLTTLGQNQTRAKSRGGVLSWSRLFIVTMRSHDQICSNQGLRIFKICLTETEQVNVMKLALLIKKLINRREKSELSTVIEPLETHQSAYR